MTADGVEIEVGGRTVRISNPGRGYFPARGETKLDLVRYYLSVGDGIVRALRERPCMLHRFPSGVAGDKVHQKRVPGGAPPWRAALAFAREVERRAPDLVTTTWWRKDRDPAMLFVDYNQNARDHTIASAYSVRGVPEATVSTPISWDEIDDVDPRQFTIATVPARYPELGDLHQSIDDSASSLATLLEWPDPDGLD